MKHLSTRAFLALACLLPLQAAVAAPVEVPNSGFEAVDGRPLSGWTAEDSAGSLSTWKLDTTVTHSGQSALAISKANHDGFFMLQSERIAVQPKTVYRLRTQLRTQRDSGANVYYMIRQLKAETDKSRVPNISSPLKPIYGTAGGWEDLDWAFTTADGVQQIQIGLVFSLAPIDIWVDDVRLESIVDAYKPRYEPPAPEELLSQEAATKVLDARPRATAEIRKQGDRPRLFLDGKESVPFFYKGPGSWKFNRAQIGDFKGAGANVYVISSFLGRGVYQVSRTGVWVARDKTDFSELNDLLWRVLRADPNGYIIFDLQTDPYPEWGAEHPDDVVINERGEKAIAGGDALRFGGEPQKTSASYAERYGYSYVSEQLRQDTTTVLQQFDGNVRNHPAGKAVIGYFINGGDDGQMFAWGDRSDQLTDYSLASQIAFRGWLKAKYRENSALQKAWRSPAVTLETALLPSAVRRLATPFFLNEQTDQDIIDYRRFHSEGTVDTKNIYAAALRKAHGTPIIIGTYYAGPTIGITSHRATEYLLQGGQFNFVTSVLAYGATRAPGGPGKAHQAWSSLLLHNTIGLAEEDFRSWKSVPTNLVRDEQTVVRVQTAEESNALIRRDTGRMLANGNGAWWFDMDGGWFNDPSILKAVKESTDAARLDLRNDTLPAAEVAVFVDEYSLDCVNHQNTRAHRNAISQQLIEMKSSGVPFHTYLQNDIANPNLPQYKLYVFLDAYHLEAATWEAIQKLRRDGKTLAFMHAPGVISGELLKTGDAAEAIGKVTGIQVQGGEEQALALLPSKSTPADKSLYTRDGTISFSNWKAPTFIVTDTGATPLASYKANGKTAVAWRDFGNWKSLFFGGVGMDAFFFNALARGAGAWVAAPAGNAVFASQKFLTIHALHSGEEIVQLIQPAKVTDLADGKVLSPRTQSLKLSMKRGETRWFYLE